MNCSRWLALGAMSVVMGLAPVLAAAAPIEWEAPDGCPSTRAVEDELRRALGHEPTELGNVSRVRGVVVAEPAGYRLTLEVVDGGRKSLRSFRAGRCEDLATAAALAVALAVHPGADGSAAHDAPGPAAALEVSTPVATAPADRGEDDVAGSGFERLTWAAGASGVLDVGALPDPGVGVGLTVRAMFAPLELDVHGLLLPAQRLGVGAAESVELGLMAAGLRACLRLLEQGLVIDGCVGGEAGRYSASGVGLQRGREARDVWVAVGPAVAARTAFSGPLQLELLAEPLVALARKQYAVDATDVVHSPSVVDLRVQIGLVIGASPEASGP